MLFEKYIRKHELSGDQQRAFLFGMVISVFGVLTHLSNIFTFRIFGILEMSYLNYFSVFLWLLCLIFFLKGNFTIGLNLVLFEVIFHCALAVHFIGGSSGFHYFILGILPASFFMPIKRKWVKLATATFVGTVFIFLNILSKNLSPFYLLSQSGELYYTVYNSTMFVATLFIIAYFYQTGVERAEAALEREYQRSEGLLLNILPEEIAARLKEKESQSIADSFLCVTVLFSDIKGFTRLCSTISAEKTVEILNAVFSRFDRLAKEFGLEKIKTIGDAYMVAGGIPHADPHHAANTARMALKMNSEMNAVCRAFPEAESLQIRIGMASGTAVAGVIGTHKFAYDVWGDTVNLASRMESHGEAGKIQVSEDCAKLLDSEFELECRGEIEVKGKGRLTSYWLKTEKY